MDDVTVYRGSFEECLINLETILHRCIEKNLACHLLVEIEYKAWWAVTKLNLDIGRTGLKRILDINELEELRNDAYSNSKIEKDKLKKWHD